MSNWLQIANPFVQTEEGCRLTAYPDPVSGGDPWTIGYGATGPHIIEGLVWTQEQADTDLKARLTVLGNTILAAAKVALNDNQLAALMDFAYNEGLWALLDTSTLWRFLQQGDYDEAAAQFPLWDIACGRPVMGLETRRMRERTLFLSPVQTA